jgi:hypothetical protein
LPRGTSAAIIDPTPDARRPTPDPRRPTQEHSMDDRLNVNPGAEHLPPSSSPTATDAGPADNPLDDPRVLQILSTEHWSLLSARSLVYNESFARAGMFLTFLSASLVALAFVATAMQFDRTFLLLASMLLFVDLVIGLATLGRMLDTSVDDLRAIAGMNRIRNAYVQIAPAIQPFLSSSIFDDSAGVMQTYGEPEIRAAVPAFIHGLTTAGGMISVIDAILAAALAGIVTVLVGASLAAALAAAGIAFVVIFAAVNRWAYQTIVGYESSMESRFPSQPAA